LGAGNHVITVYATDISNNVSSCTHTVTVLDTIKPTLTCPANISVPSSFGQCAAIVMFINPNGTDNCPGAITTQIAGLPSGSAFPVGTTTNTFRVTDASGNSSTCSFTVTVNDVEAPLITCGANVTANNTTNLCSGVVTVASPTITDNCSTGATPVAGNALYFDGADDYISTVLDVSETSYTAEMWFRTTKANCGIFSVTQGVFGGNNDRHIILTGGNIRVRVWNNEVITTSGTNYADGNWHHVAHVFGTGVPNRIYVDGILKATGSFQASAFNWQDRINLGYSADAGGSFFQGELENVRVWDVAKSQAEIIQGMNADPIGCTPQVWYKFNQGTAGGNNTAITQADDNSGNNHPGPLTNFARTGSTSNFVTGLSFTP
ncbi:MAG TPA: HYR domain-containing protein, partial [Chitinophagaceae bacterium]|nr:HYR domain-containing protein [Chitinophagaceae bacterium]